MSNQALEKALNALFEQSRLVFFDDENGKNRAEFDELELPDIEKIITDNNEFTVKYRVLRQEREKKFLIYRKDGAPKDENNWLLDLQMSYPVYKADEISLIASDLNLSPERFYTTVKAFPGFFANRDLRNRLKRAVDPSAETEDTLRLKMLAILSPLKKADDFEQVVMSLIKGQLELEKSSDYAAEDIATKNFGIDLSLYAYFLQKMKAEYGYEKKASVALPIKDFVFALFHDHLAKGDAGNCILNSKAALFFTHWQKQLDPDDFEAWAKIEERALNVRARLGSEHRDKAVLGCAFPVIDTFIIEKLLQRLKELIEEKTLNTASFEQSVVTDFDFTLPELLAVRREMLFYPKFAPFYRLIEAAIEFKLEIGSFLRDLDNWDDTWDQAVTLYTEKWYRIDTSYRLFFSALEKISVDESQEIRHIADVVNHIYSTDFLNSLSLKLGTSVKQVGKWPAGGQQVLLLQKFFYKLKVIPQIKTHGNRTSKLAVIISDGFRYELGVQLNELLNEENGLSATVDPMLTMLPAYTQMGMAALLPNDELSWTGKENDATVLVNGDASAGIKARGQILEKNALGRRTACVTADEILKQTTSQLRSGLFKDHDVIYIYHDLIDNAGEHNESELLEKCSECLDVLRDLVRKVISANINNLYITADHGFIYKDADLISGVDSIDAPHVDAILLQKQRFMLAKAGTFKSDDFNVVISSEKAGLKEGFEIVTPLTAVRYRRSGVKSRYVHGGMTLQECLIPLIKVNNVRKDTVKDVEVRMLTVPGNITSSQIVLKFCQEQPVGKGVRAVRLRFGFYRHPDDDAPCSTTAEYEFNATDPALALADVGITLALFDDVPDGPVYLRKDIIRNDRSEAEFDEEPVKFIRRKPSIARDDFDF